MVCLSKIKQEYESNMNIMFQDPSSREVAVLTKKKKKGENMYGNGY